MSRLDVRRFAPGFASALITLLVLGAMTSPTRAEPTMALVSLSVLADEPVRVLARVLAEESPALVVGAEWLRAAGGARGLPVLLGGVWLIDPELGREAFASVALAAAATYALKYATGRPRPYTGERAFQWWTGDDAWHSFPSGHASTAFALAGAVLSKYPEATPYVVAYASAVALSRLVLDEHWLSDVVVGALIGSAVSGRLGGAVGWEWTW